MHKEFLDKFFHYASRAVIIIPILAIAAVLLLAKNPFQKTESISTPIKPTPQEEEVKKPSFDLNGSYYCDVQSKDSSTSAYIKNKAIAVVTEEKGLTTRTVFVKDCLYSWDADSLRGEKTCGLSQYVSILEALGQFGLANPDSILATILGNKNATGSGVSFNKVCKAKTIKQDSLFEVPQNVFFIEKKPSGK